jgi:glycosyltransferase involved in cell wall biosynthesis
MNRARTEAMMSGACVVQVNGAHDLDRFAKDGENIVLVDNSPDIIASICVDLIENRYKEAVQIGQNAKAMAHEKFERKRYRQDWIDLITKDLGIKL